MRRYRRLVLIDRVIPFLAAIVGLVALAGAVAVQLNTEARTAAVTAEIANLKGAVDALGKRADELGVAEDDGTAEGLLALQDRMNKLESAWTQSKTAAGGPATAAPAALSPTDEATQTAAIDPDLPTTDCIPLGTRFMVIPNETFPLCQSKAVVKTGNITADSVFIEGPGDVVETGFANLPGTSCTVMVFTADVAGFGEVRVTCT